MWTLLHVLLTNSLCINPRHLGAMSQPRLSSLGWEGLQCNGTRKGAMEQEWLPCLGHWGSFGFVKQRWISQKCCNQAKSSFSNFFWGRRSLHIHFWGKQSPLLSHPPKPITFGQEEFLNWVSINSRSLRLGLQQLSLWDFPFTKILGVIF